MRPIMKGKITRKDTQIGASRSTFELSVFLILALASCTPIFVSASDGSGLNSVQELSLELKPPVSAIAVSSLLDALGMVKTSRAQASSVDEVLKSLNPRNAFHLSILSCACWEIKQNCLYTKNPDVCLTCFAICVVSSEAFGTIKRRRKSKEQSNYARECTRASPEWRNIGSPSAGVCYGIGTLGMGRAIKACGTAPKPAVRAICCLRTDSRRGTIVAAAVLSSDIYLRSSIECF